MVDIGIAALPSACVGKLYAFFGWYARCNAAVTTSWFRSRVLVTTLPTCCVCTTLPDAVLTVDRTDLVDRADAVDRTLLASLLSTSAG
jgi:hypothetical protein